MGDLFFGRSNISRATVVRQNNRHHFPVLIFQRNLKLVSQSIYHGSTNAESGERTWTGEESNFREIRPVSLIFDKLIVDEGKNLLS